jgi:hypothetical protein
MKEARALVKIYEKGKTNKELNCLYNELKRWGKENGYTLTKVLIMAFEYFFTSTICNKKPAINPKFIKAKKAPNKGLSDGSQSPLL